jgi:hypothetical protein
VDAGLGCGDRMTTDTTTSVTTAARFPHRI